MFVLDWSGILFIITLTDYTQPRRKENMDRSTMRLVLVGAVKATQDDVVGVLHRIQLIDAIDDTLEIELGEQTQTGVSIVDDVFFEDRERFVFPLEISGCWIKDRSKLLDDDFFGGLFDDLEDLVFMSDDTTKL